MLRYLLYIFVLLSVSKVYSQKLSAYIDIQQKFYSYDDGITSMQEVLPPLSYKIGKTGIAYIDNINNFRIYRGGVKNKLNEFLTIDYGVSDNYIYYKTNNSLYLIDGNEEIMLCRLVGDYAVGDSIVLYYDRVRNILHSYSNGKSYELENNLATPPYSSFKVSDNMIAYENFMMQFKIFYQQEAIILETLPVKSYQIGRNTVAYVDNNGNFKIWHNGDQVYSEAFPPKKYLVGDNVVAFISYDGNFRICYNDQVETIGFFERKFAVSDFLVAYEDGNGYFKIFDKGEHVTIDNYYPKDFIMQYNSMAYIDKTRTLRLYQHGLLRNVSNLVSSMEQISLDYDVLRYTIGNNMFRFFYDGEER